MKNKEAIDHLLEPCRKGDRRAQEALYSSLAPKLYGVCMRYAKDDFEAQDILQTGFIKVFKSLNSFRGDGSLEGWIRKVIVNTAIESYHKTKSEPELVDIAEVHDLAGEYIEIDTLEAKDLLVLIRSLPEGFRIVFNMFTIEGYSHQEIAEKLQISTGTSKSQLSRARVWLKEKIKIMERGIYEIDQK